MSAISTSQPSQKRRRTDEGDDACPPIDEMVKDDDLWYSDGNIVVGSGTSLFRVHKGVLSKHSTVFDDMFGGPPHRGEELEGCPFVRLYGDNPVEVRCLLKEMYGLREREDRKISIDTLCAFVRLGEKYDIANMRRQGASILEKIYGPNLHIYKMRQNDFNSDRGPYENGSFPVTPWKKQYCFSVYPLARDHGMKSIAARALYECCRFPLASITPALVPRLTPDILWACALGREELMKRGAEQLLKLSQEGVQKLEDTDDNLPHCICENNMSCKRSLRVTYDLVGSGLAAARVDVLDGGGFHSGRGGDPFLKRAERGLCTHCRFSLHGIMGEEVASAWEALPDILATAMEGIPV
ncbi:hypothetical protein PENSPDRAFT_694485 [Peniophora sp. CONT]|nr:hypothetical protein PENSPDRAFT_694485 [Peniophora sp. CONT]